MKTNAIFHFYSLNTATIVWMIPFGLGSAIR